MSNSRGSKVKNQNQRQEGDVFWMNLEDAKQLISKYESQEEDYERRNRKKNV